MYRISDQQIDYILNDISARGVEMESLQQNLLDHICCVIENNLEENGDFENFYQKTVKTFYKDALWEIEEETLQLLTYKNYYTMKKIMIYSGTFSVFGFIAGSIFKMMHWPGASAILLLAMITISLVFLPLLFVLKSREVSTVKDKMMIAVGTIFGILFSLSSLFKIMHWPGANVMWFMALGLLLFVFIPLYFFSGIRNPDTKVNTIITTIILIAAGGMLFALTNVRSSSHVNRSKLKHYLQFEELVSHMKTMPRDTTKQHAELYRVSEGILSNCAKLKELVLKDEIGQASIPKDFEEKHILIQESHLGESFDAKGEGEKLLFSLKTQIDDYNKLASKHEMIYSIENIIDDADNLTLVKHSNYQLLNTLCQIQLFVLENERL